MFICFFITFFCFISSSWSVDDKYVGNKTSCKFKWQPEPLPLPKHEESFVYTIGLLELEFGEENVGIQTLKRFDEEKSGPLRKKFSLTLHPCFEVSEIRSPQLPSDKDLHKNIEGCHVEEGWNVAKDYKFPPLPSPTFKSKDSLPPIISIANLSNNKPQENKKDKGGGCCGKKKSKIFPKR